jgi:membrane protease subunit HflK
MANGQWPEEFGDLVAQLRRRFRNFTLPRSGPLLVVGAVLAIVLLWSTWYTVPPEATAVVQRFGSVARTTSPGLHFKLPLGVEKATVLPTARVLKEEFGFRTLQGAESRTRYERGDFSAESLMLTGDLNVIDVRWIVQYRIEDPVKFLFKVREQSQTLRDVAEAVMRRVVGNRLGSDVLTVARVEVSTEVRTEMQKILSDYETGIRIVTVELQDVTPPDPVKPAFNEVNEARQDLERMINQAQEQANKVIPKARGEAKQAVTEAEGYATERVNQAEGEAARFASVLDEYQRVPEVTRRRLYLETMSEVMGRAKGLYIVDSEQKALIPWLSLDSNSAPKPVAQPVAREEQP